MCSGTEIPMTDNTEKHTEPEWNTNFYLWFFTRFSKHKVSSHAGQSTFFLLMSFFPFLMLLIRLLSFLPGLNPNTVVNNMQNIGPASLGDLIAPVLSEVAQASGGSLYLFTIITILWSGSKGFDSLAMGLDSIYAARGKRGYIKRRLSSLVYLIGFIIMLVINIGLIVFGKHLLNYLEEKLNLPFNGFFLSIVLRYGLILFLFLTFFVLMFRLVPYTPRETPEQKKKRTMRTELPGAIVTTIIWIVFTRFYTIYVDYRLDSPSYYGSLASVFLTLLWLYFCIIFIFVGALYNNYYYRTGETATSHLIKDIPGALRYLKNRITGRHS